MKISTSWLIDRRERWISLRRFQDKRVAERVYFDDWDSDKKRRQDEKQNDMRTTPVDCRSMTRICGDVLSEDANSIYTLLLMELFSLSIISISWSNSSFSLCQSFFSWSFQSIVWTLHLYSARQIVHVLDSTVVDEIFKDHIISNQSQITTTTFSHSDF